MPNFKKGGKGISSKKVPMAAKSMHTIGKPSIGGHQKGMSEGGATSGRSGANIKFNRKG